MFNKQNPYRPFDPWEDSVSDQSRNVAYGMSQRHGHPFSEKGKIVPMFLSLHAPRAWGDMGTILPEKLINRAPSPQPSPATVWIGCKSLAGTIETLLRLPRKEREQAINAKRTQ